MTFCARIKYILQRLDRIVMEQIGISTLFIIIYHIRAYKHHRIYPLINFKIVEINYNQRKLLEHLILDIRIMKYQRHRQSAI